MNKQEVIVLAGGTGDLGRYLHEELIKDGRYSVALLTRKNLKTDYTPSLPRTTVHRTDYTESSVLTILSETSATALISLIRCEAHLYLPIHTALIRACLQSRTCKRFIPSEWAGNIEAFPHLPRSYEHTRAPVRDLLQATAPSDLKWTLVNFGWFMEYFLPEEKSYMRRIPGEFPIDPGAWTYTNRPFKRSYRTLEDIAASIKEYETNPGPHTSTAEMEEWTVTGATACPKETTLRQREKYFSSIHFLTVEEMVMRAGKDGHV
ncbi:hypothetical protein ASPSYDRAFT_1168812 [Aspergillus sydowii CBS 593.65]|uniref:NAD(P)-binding domain-containing protein n=1 Tax=Aspergillus sydowii CBS 593.65 TaxID=1036612 RepID=A0A1L9TUA0_9EURO|nr:uncharacterized protein ASPSYDRAFT_1168812 [Aspergillus sydowii CBS 593.65]OJJ63009.1 hypothetical protein ASPSYDRAFT_1168812 [Aspergillus sydowii CBS 593.65]